MSAAGAPRTLSIFGRTFLLMLAALVVAEGIGLALVIFKTPPRAGEGRAPMMRPERPPHDDGMEGMGPVPDPQAFDRQRNKPARGFVPRDAPARTGVLSRFPPDFYRNALLLFGIGLVALAPLAWLFAGALSGSIRRFSEAARRLGNDPRAPPLPSQGPAEMRMAAQSFNAMQVRLNRLLRERTLMIAAIAHDLRTPLTRLAFRLEGMPAAQREKAEADVQEMKSMIAGALDFMRERSLAGPRERVDLRLLLESVVDGQADLGQTVSLEPGPPVTVQADPLALKRAITNLVDNAVKYGQRARLRLGAAGDRCVVEVDDDGPGIAPALRERVFEPFFRLEASRNRDTGGIGLGLATVRSIALDHGGDVRIDNRPGGGLRVSLALPLERG